MVTSTPENVKHKLLALQRAALASGFTTNDLRNNYKLISENDNTKENVFNYSRKCLFFATLFVFTIATATTQLNYVVDSILQTRCFISNNYLVWEATRPISDCTFCQNVTAPIVLWNITRKSFEKYAYTSLPIIAKGAAAHWHSSELNYSLLKRLYTSTEGSYESVDNRCQFLSFKSDVMSPKEVFEMSDARAMNLDGEVPWYVGWGNCHPEILATIRKYYDYPDFLPEDAEFPDTENIFFGYEIGAVMHLDYIPRLMWQGQVHGNKTWSVVPIPECEHVCTSFQFYVEPGDIVLLDTRVWYHATKIPKGQFSLTIQSEYG